MKRAHHQVDKEPSLCCSRSVAAWKCVAELAAQRRDAQAFHRIVCSVPKIGRASIACRSNSNKEYRYWSHSFDRVHVAHFRRYNLATFEWTYNCVSQRWFRHHQLHRRGGPAKVTYKFHVNSPCKDPFDKQEEWYEDGALHRVGGPAYVDGFVEKWYLYGSLYREHGLPAVWYKCGRSSTRV